MNNKKILLINPFWNFRKVYPPTNLAELAAYLKEKSFEVEILDLNYELCKHEKKPEELFLKSVEMTNRINPAVVGIVCDTVHLPFCHAFTKMLKKSNKKIKIVLGGNHASLSPESIFELCDADFIVRGEGEKTFSELLKCIFDDKPVRNVKGITYLHKGKIISNPDNMMIKNLDDLPMLAFDLLPDLKNYLKINMVDIGVSASRGCSYKCVFCASSTFWGHQRKKSVNRIIEEINQLIDNHGITNFSFDDLCISTDKNWFNQLLKEVKKLDINFRCFIRIDHLQEISLDLLKEAGCYHVYHGVEGGNEKIRSSINKSNYLTNEKIKKLIEKEIEKGIEVTASFMVATPNEKKEDVLDTINFCKEVRNLGANVQLWIMTPYPGIPALEKNEVVFFDRWNVLKQADVFGEEQRQLYGKYIESIKKYNPDNYIFKTKVSLEDLEEMYKSAKQEIGFENGV